MPYKRFRWSDDDLLIPVDLLVPQGANADPLLDVVQFTFVQGGLPLRFVPADPVFYTGFWVQVPGQILAGITIGPNSSVTLAVGTWAAGLRIVDDPTVPFDWVDTVTIQ